MFLLPSCGKHETAPGGEGQALVDASRQELVNALEERDRLLKLVREIAESMDEIKRLEALEAVTDASTGDNAAKRARLVTDMRAVRHTLRQRREQLQALEDDLQRSGLYTGELQQTVALLRGRVDTQAAAIERLQAQLSRANAEIGTLNDAVDSLSSTVTSVRSERDMAKTESMELEAELNTCYYAVASKEELKKHRIIETPFLRKSRILKGEFDRGFFSATDKRSLGRIPLGRRKGTVLTNHPAGSFEITEGAQGERALVIRDPERFWATTNYLVVQAD